MPLPARARVVVLVSHLHHLNRLPSRLAGEVALVAREYAQQADVAVVDRPFDSALAFVREIEHAKGADVLVCAGATGAYLQRQALMPVIPMRPDGMDLLRALSAAARLSDKVALLHYREMNHEIRELEGVLALRAEQATYRTLEDAQELVSRFAAAGHRVIIGSSMVTELAEDLGLVGLLSLGATGIRHAIDKALALFESAQADAARRRRMQAILEHLRDGVLSVDAQGVVQSMNVVMASWLGTRPDALIGRPLDELVPGSGMKQVLASRQPVRDRMLAVGGRQLLANLSPLMDGPRLEGGVLAAQEVEAVQRADRHIRAQSRQTRFAARHDFSSVGGESEPMRRMLALARSFAASSSTVLITGESGTGKELVAQGIHNHGPRRGRPFVAVNCAAFPETLLESELFGHEEGAFTGSRRGGKVGLIEAAHTGTLFLDEIGDMPTHLQSRLLRVLQEREVLRLGGVQPMPVDIRFIAATHRDLQQHIAEGRFRADLYYRLNILRIHLPPLRERLADHELIARRIAARVAPTADASELLAHLLPRFRRYPWPGNVREMENMIERALLYAEQQRAPAGPACFDWLPQVLPELHADAHLAATPAPHGFRDASKALEAELLRTVMDQCGGKVHLAAKELGISRTTLWRRLREDTQKSA